jgi:hypothetical protein
MRPIKRRGVLLTIINQFEMIAATNNIDYASLHLHG